MKNGEKFEVELTSHFKIDMRNLKKFDPSTQNFKNSHLMGFFWTKYIMFVLKPYIEVMFHDTEKWCKIWRKTDLWFGKWYGLKVYRGVMYDNNEEWCNIEGKLICGLENDMGLKFTEELCMITIKNDAILKEN